MAIELNHPQAKINLEKLNKLINCTVSINSNLENNKNY